MGDGITKVLAEKSFDVNKNAKLVVRHEFGNVTCSNWDKDVISVKITGKSETSNSEKAEKAFSRINWEVNGDRNEVYVECKISGKGNGSKNPNVSVDLEIFLPKSAGLDFNHKFGNAYIEEAEGPAYVSSEYGSVKIHSLSSSESKLKVEFGSGKINHFGGSDMSVEYGKLTVGTAGNVSVRSEYSEFYAEEVNDLDLESEGGNAKIGSVANLKGSSEFGNLDIKNLSQSIHVSTEYGSMVIRQVDEKFSNIHVVNEYGSAKIYIPESATYHIEAETEYGSFKYPESLANFTYKVISQGESTYKGIIGNGSNPTSKVTVSSEYGNLSIISN
jgi:hypothetical protein